MQIILKQRNIEAALKQYIASQGISLEGKKVSVEFTAGRKESGITAEIDIDDANESVTPDLGTVTPLATVKIVEAAVETEAAPAANDTPVEATTVAPGSSLFA